MIAILINKLTNPEQEKYFKQFTDIIFSTNKDFKYLDLSVTKSKKTLESFLRAKKIDGILMVDPDDQIKLFNLENFDSKTNFICVSDGVWVQKKSRFFCPFVTNQIPLCQSIIIQTAKNSFKHPIIDDTFEKIKELYRKKEYKKFVIESEKWIFDNSKENNKQIMLRYYCSLVYNFKLNNLRKSLEHIGIAIMLAPFMSELWCAWGDILLDKKLYDKSEAIYRCACSIKDSRDIFDLQPMWIDRNDLYPNKMLDTVRQALTNVQIIKNDD